MGEVGPARRLRTHQAAWGLTALTLAVLAAALVFTALNTSRIGTARVGLEAVLSAAVLLYAASGRLIASRRPDNWWRSFQKEVAPGEWFRQAVSGLSRSATLRYRSGRRPARPSGRSDLVCCRDT